MTDKKRSRMNLLDSLAAAGAATPAASMMSSNRALRSARDAVDSHNVWELDPYQIEDGRLRDRLDPSDVADLRDAIEANGQTVPILVRRHPTTPDKYLLVYGARRLAAIRQSDKVKKVRALVANLDDQSAVTAQISENMARRDLSYIEKALFARQLVDNGFGNQSQVAEVLTVTKSTISMALAVVDMLTPDLIEAIGPAHGIGRPRWEAMGKAIQETGQHVPDLIDLAHTTRDKVDVAPLLDGTQPQDSSVVAFETVEKAVQKALPKVAKEKPEAPAPKGTAFDIGGRPAGTIQRTNGGLKIDLNDRAFAAWIESNAQDVLADLFTRWRESTAD